MTQNVLVTGGAGFLGSHLVKKLLAEGNRVTVVDNLQTGNDANLKEVSDNPNFRFFKHDITSKLPDGMSGKFESIGSYDAIYNLACAASPIHYQADPIHTFDTSVIGMRNMLELAKINDATLFHTSTSEVYGDPKVHPQPESYFGNVNPIGPRSCYDEGKRAAETLANDFYKQYGVDVRLVRIFNTYGPYMNPDDNRVVSNFIVQALNGEPITLYGDGQQTRSFQYVDDLINGFGMFMDMPAQELQSHFSYKGEPQIPVLNMGNPKEYTIKELAEAVIAKTGSSSEIVYRELPVDDPKVRQPNISRANEVLGWKPVISLDEGLENTIQYFSDPERRKPVLTKQY